MAVGNVLGGGVIVLLAAALWLLYLVPGWVKRREYMATERNAVRLQQTIRTLAETAETPEEVFVELDARTVAAQQKILRRGQRARAAEVRAVAKEQLVAEQTERAQARAEARAREQAQKREQEQERVREEAARQAAAAAAKAEAQAWEEAERRASAASRQARIDHEVSQAREGRARPGAGASGAGLPRVPGAVRSKISASTSASVSLAQGRRRGRLFGTSAAFVGVVLGVVGLLAGGLGILLAVIGVLLLLGGAGVLIQISRKTAAVGSPQSVTSPARTTTAEVSDYRVHDETESEEAGTQEASAEWTPRPLPRPLHLSRGTIAQSTMASINAASQLRQATQRAELDERAERIVAARAAVDGTAMLSPVVRGAAERTAAQSNAAQTTVAQRASEAGDQRYAAMGIIDEAGSGNFNLEEAMRRRRAS